MKKFLEKLKQNNLLLDGANVVAGIVMMAAFVLFIITKAWLALLFVVWSAGVINIVNGMKTMRKKGKQTLGQSMLLFGVIILFGGTILVITAKKKKG